MKWLKKIFGIKSPIAKKQAQLQTLQEKGFQAQRNGDLALAGKYYLEAEMLDTEIIEMAKEK